MSRSIACLQGGEEELAHWMCVLLDGEEAAAKAAQERRFAIS